MIQEPIFLLNGILIIGCMWLASLAKSGKKEAVMCSYALAANFLFCAMSFTDMSPKSALDLFGLHMSHKETWMLADTILGGFCVTVAFSHWWGYVLCLLCAGQVGVHAARLDNVIGVDEYSSFLDIVLHAQMAVFFLIGGRGVSDLLHSGIAVFLRSRRLETEARPCSEAEE